MIQHRRISILAVSALAMFASWALWQKPGQDSVSAEDMEILRRIREVYARCNSYRDEGEVRTVFIKANGDERTVLKPFKTAFVRPDRFRFEYRDYGNVRTVILDDGDGTFLNALKTALGLPGRPRIEYLALLSQS